MNKVFRILIGGRHGAARDLNQLFDARLSLGDRLADRVAAIGGSWTFILGFSLFLALWAAINLMLPEADRFDAYPFIFLNLLLSTLAALQAPVIMMSQNRQAAKDRLEARLDYETNQRAEAEIAALHGKIDALAGRIEQLLGDTRSAA